MATAESVAVSVVNKQKRRFQFLLYSTIIALVSYFTFTVLLRKGQYSYNFKYTFEDVEPEDLWKYFADFDNHFRINPTMFDYQILHSTKKPNSDSTESYEYSVSYREHLVYLPWVTNEAIGNLTITSEGRSPKTSKSPTGTGVGSNVQHYRIVSNHTTYQNGLSYFTTDEMFFMPGQHLATTDVRQNIQYDCQLLFAFYCRWEFLAQKELIQTQLRRDFKYTKL